jgi:hypothetical protein
MCEPTLFTQVLVRVCGGYDIEMTWAVPRRIGGSVLHWIVSNIAEN